MRWYSSVLLYGVESTTKTYYFSVIFVKVEWYNSIVFQTVFVKEKIPLVNLGKETLEYVFPFKRVRVNVVVKKSFPFFLEKHVKEMVRNDLSDNFYDDGHCK